MKTIAIISDCEQQECRLKELFSERYSVIDKNGLKNNSPDVFIITAKAYEAEFLDNNPEVNAYLSDTPGLMLWEYDDMYRLMTYRNCRLFSELRVEKNASAIFEKLNKLFDVLTKTPACLLHLSDIQSDIHSMYRESSYKGVIEVEYHNFARIYQFVDKLIERSGKPMQTLLLSLVPHDEKICTKKDLSYANEILSKAIQMTLRKNDVMTNYSDSQMLVLLVDADDAGGHFATNRIINTFFGLYDDELYQLDYDIRPVGKNRR